jgi:hypothetical protein
MKRLVVVGLAGLTCLGVVSSLGLDRSAAARNPVAYCKGYPWMENVPRGSMLAASNRLCVERKAGTHRYRALDYINPPHNITIAARLHVRLTRGGQFVSRSKEYVTPSTPVTIKSPYQPIHGGKKLCATLWNHDGLGYYKVESVCHRPFS